MFNHRLRRPLTPNRRGDVARANTDGAMIAPAISNFRCMTQARTFGVSYCCGDQVRAKSAVLQHERLHRYHVAAMTHQQGHAVGRYVSLDTNWSLRAEQFHHEAFSFQGSCSSFEKTVQLSLGEKLVGSGFFVAANRPLRNVSAEQHSITL